VLLNPRYPLQANPQPTPAGTPGDTRQTQTYAQADFEASVSLAPPGLPPQAELDTAIADYQAGVAKFAGMPEDQVTPEAQVELDQAFLLCFEDSRLSWLIHDARGESLFEDFVIPESASQAWSVQTLMQRLRFFGKRQAGFRVGLALRYGTLTPSHQPLLSEKPRRLHQAFVLESLDRSLQICVEANTSLRVGRDPQSDVVLPTVGRHQAVLQNKMGV
jgi:hypothetical protein